MPLRWTGGLAQMGKIGGDPERGLGENLARPKMAKVDAQPNGMAFDVGPRVAAGGREAESRKHFIP